MPSVSALSPAITELLQPVYTPKYHGLILVETDRLRQKVSEEIWKLYRSFDGFQFSPDLQVFRFFGESMVWVNVIPTTEERWSRYKNIVFHSIVIEGKKIPTDLVRFLDERVTSLGERGPLFEVNGEPAAKFLGLAPVTEPTNA